MTWTFRATELLAYVWAIACIRHAWRAGRWPAMAAFLAASLYGFILEYGSVKSNTDYCYGDFMVMLPWWHVTVPPGYPCPDGPVVPLWIALAWGCTFYAAVTTALRVDVPWKLRALLAATVAVTLDFIVDPLAEWLGFWHWYAKGAYFGIPLDNYFGWILTIGLYVLVLLAMQRKWPPASSRFGAYGVPFAAILPAGAGVWLGMKGYAYAATAIPEWMIVVGLYAAALGLLLPWRLRLRGTLPFDPVVFGMPLTYLAYYPVLMLVSGLYQAMPGLIVSTVLVAAGVLLGYGWPYRLSSASRRSERTGA